MLVGDTAPRPTRRFYGCVRYIITAALRVIPPRIYLLLFFFHLKFFFSSVPNVAFSLFAKIKYPENNRPDTAAAAAAATAADARNIPINPSERPVASPRDIKFKK